MYGGEIRKANIYLKYDVFFTPESHHVLYYPV